MNVYINFDKWFSCLQTYSFKRFEIDKVIQICYYDYSMFKPYRFGSWGSMKVQFCCAHRLSIRTLDLGLRPHQLFESVESFQQLELVWLELVVVLFHEVHGDGFSCGDARMERCCQLLSFLRALRGLWPVFFSCRNESARQVPEQQLGQLHNSDVLEGHDDDVHDAWVLLNLEQVELHLVRHFPLSHHWWPWPSR